KGRADRRHFVNGIRLGHKLPKKNIYCRRTNLMHTFSWDQRQLMAGGQQAIPPKSYGVLESLLPPFNACERIVWVHVFSISCAAEVSNCPDDVLEIGRAHV